MQRGGLRLVLGDFAPAPVPINIIYPSRRLGSANLTAFVNAARRYFTTLPTPSGVREANDPLR